MTPDSAALRRHYAAPNLAAAILAALAAAGRDPERLDPDELAPADQFHTRGLAATEELAGFAEFAVGDRVLDLGSGLGGPARWIAKRFPVTVTGIDLSADYCRAARLLTERCGLSGRVRFVEGDALSLPFAAAGFDLVWTQHVAANIADRPRLYREVARVLMAGGRFVMHDIFAGPVAGLHLPVPWASRPEMSFLLRPEAMRELLGRCGFVEQRWADVTAATLGWLEALAARPQPASPGGGPPAGLGPWLALGEDFGAKLANLRRNLAERRIETHMAMFRRQG